MQPKEQEGTQGMRRYSLVIPQTLYDEVNMVAEKRGESVAGLLRKFVRMGIEIEDTLGRGAKIVRREGDRETELIII